MEEKKINMSHVNGVYWAFYLLWNKVTTGTHEFYKCALPFLGIINSVILLTYGAIEFTPLIPGLVQCCNFIFIVLETSALEIKNERIAQPVNK